MPDVSVAEVSDPAVAFEASTPATERTAGLSLAKPRLVFKRTENALQQPAVEDRRGKHERLLASGRAKHARGERPTWEELVEMKGAEALEAEDKNFRVMKERRSDPERRRAVAYTQGTADGIRAAVTHLLVETKLAEALQIKRRWELEDRVAALEIARRE